MSVCGLRELEACSSGVRRPSRISNKTELVCLGLYLWKQPRWCTDVWATLSIELRHSGHPIFCLSHLPCFDLTDASSAAPHSGALPVALRDQTLSTCLRARCSGPLVRPLMSPNLRGRPCRDGESLGESSSASTPSLSDGLHRSRPGLDSALLAKRSSPRVSPCTSEWCRVPPRSPLSSSAASCPLGSRCCMRSVEDKMDSSNSASAIKSDRSPSPCPAPESSVPCTRICQRTRFISSSILNAGCRQRGHYVA